MGRKKINKEDKKKSISIAIKPELFRYFKERHINLSSLVNKLLEEYINENKKM